MLILFWIQILTAVHLFLEVVLRTASSLRRGRWDEHQLLVLANLASHLLLELWHHHYVLLVRRIPLGSHRTLLLGNPALKANRRLDRRVDAIGVCQLVLCLLVLYLGSTRIRAFVVHFDSHGILVLPLLLSLNPGDEILLICDQVLLVGDHSLLGSNLNHRRLILVDLPLRLLIVHVWLQLRLRRTSHLSPGRCSLIHKLVKHRWLLVSTAAPVRSARQVRCTLLIASKRLHRAHRELPGS